MIIKTLMENTTSTCDIHTEHGLSLYIEANGHKILFDAGQTEAFARNAKQMGVDLLEVDVAILSHGHYDHSGGLGGFLDMNHKANLYINEHAFASFRSGQEKNIGIDAVLKGNERVVITSDYTKLYEGIELFTYNTLERKYLSDSGNLFVINGDAVELDSFLHEQYLLLTEKEKRVLISGCSHKGIRNIVEWVAPDVLVGGFHFKGITMDEEGKAKLDAHATFLKQYKTQYYTCHCTGVEQYEYLKKQMGTQVEYLAAGDIVEIY